MRTLRSAVVLAVAAFACGCGGDQLKTADQGKADLEDFAQFLKTIAADGKKPPTSMREFEPLEPMAPMASASLRNGKMVYVWGAGLSDGGSAVVAYEKQAETEGGWVLVQDGTVKKMSADEFKAAPKAKK